MTSAHAPYKNERETAYGLFRKAAFLSLWGSFILVSGCRTVPSAPFANTLVAIGVFENNTPEPILEGVLTSLLNETWIGRHFAIVQNPEKAAFVLTGTIDQIAEAPRSLNREGRGVAHRVTIGVTYRLSSKNNDPPLVWNDTAYADWFTRAADLPYDQSERNRAIRQAFLELSGRAADRLTEIIVSSSQVLSKT